MYTQPHSAAPAPAVLDATLTLAGELDIYNAAEVKDRIREALAVRPRVLTIDLSAAGWVDSAGLGVLIGARRKASVYGGRVVLRRPCPDFRAVLRVTRAERLFTIEE